MRGKPLYPFAAIAVIGLALMLVLSFVGADQKNTRLASEGEVEQPSQGAVDTSDPMALGQQVYQASCIGCHGANYESGMAVLTGLAERYTLEEVIAIIEEGIPGTAMAPGYAKGQDAEAVALYLLENAK